jgi:hypothetical protein
VLLQHRPLSIAAITVSQTTTGQVDRRLPSHPRSSWFLSAPAGDAISVPSRGSWCRCNCGENRIHDETAAQR